MIGCTPGELRTYLEQQFTGEMAWTNYGTHWHVDHRKPCAEFDFTIPEHQLMCFHYTNLRPRLVDENLQAGGQLRGRSGYRGPQGRFELAT